MSLYKGHGNTAGKGNSILKITQAASKDLVVLITRRDDTLQRLAQQYLGDANKDWVIADYNQIDHIVPGIEIAIPLKPFNPTGVFGNGLQTIPILCYHRFDDERGKMSVSTDKFRQQMQYLKDNGYRVISLKDALSFFQGKQAIPLRSVVITIDDGYRSNYTEAFPIFQEFNFPATIFLYTDFLGAPDALTYTQIREMHKSGLIDFQPHSKSHPNLVLMHGDDSEEEYRQRVEAEIESSSSRISSIIETDMFSFAYPFGDTNELVISKLKDRNFSVAATVQPGTNPAFATPFMLKRTMIFGDHDYETFIASLQVFESLRLKE
ncbi:MAG: polysaccharide deacetylase family protein [Gammaproteobacteria bacterium]|nr:polysaccharide deacetylase family protein [Gammaproteobacteria bacterium]